MSMPTCQALAKRIVWMTLLGVCILAIELARSIFQRPFRFPGRGDLDVVLGFLGGVWLIYFWRQWKQLERLKRADAVLPTQSHDINSDISQTGA